MRWGNAVSQKLDAGERRSPASYVALTTDDSSTNYRLLVRGFLFDPAAGVPESSDVFD